jgi:dipeptidyl-peptidase-4
MPSREKRMPFRYARIALLAATLFLATVAAPEARAQRRAQPATPAAAATPFTIEGVLGPAWPYELVAARKAERIAWLAWERGRRNVYMAAAPGFTPRALTRHTEDDGIDLTDLAISDDGSVLVFVRGHSPNSVGWVANPRSDPRGADRTIWAVRTDGGEPWRITEGGSPTLSPDGRWVAVARDGQLYRYPVDPVEARMREGFADQPLFEAWGRNGGPVWSPDSRFIAFTSQREDHSYIGVYDTAVPKVTYLAPGVDRDSSPTWSPDGTRVAFLRRPGQPFGRQSGITGGRRPPRPGQSFQEVTEEDPPDGLNQAAFPEGHTLELWVADRATAEGRSVWRTQPADTVYTAVRSLLWGGEQLLFQAEPDNWRHWFSVPVDGRGRYTEPEDLTPGQGLAEFMNLSPDGEWIYYTSNADDIDLRHLYRTRTRGGRNKQLTKGEGIETYPAVPGEARWLAMLNAGVRQPLSVAVVDADGGDPRVIFPVLAPDFPAAAHVVPQNVMLTAADGVEFHNQLFLPADLKPGEKRPAILFTHGGSQRQMLLGYHYMHFYHMAYAINQYLAAKGYIVISVNYRSGIGYGRTFRNAPERGSRGNSEYQDVEAAGRYLQNHPNVDPARIGLWGLSYGGLLTAQGLARNSDIFSAGVDLAGVHLWGSSIDSASVSYLSSPIAAIDSWKSPVLLIQGDDDRNVEFSQTVGLVQLLRARGIYHELIVFPDDVHDSLLYERWVLSFKAMEDFFRRFLPEKK